MINKLFTLIKIIKKRLYLILNPEVPFKFIHINKTGGVSINNNLGWPVKMHEDALEIKNKIGDKNWKKHFTFSFVRNPWDKVVSHYHYRKLKNIHGLKDDPIEFNEWVKLAYGEKNEMREEECMSPYPLPICRRTIYVNSSEVTRSAIDSQLKGKSNWNRTAFRLVTIGPCRR